MWQKVCSIFIVCIVQLTLNTSAISQIDIQPMGTYHSGIYDESAAEIVVHEPNTQRLYVVNAESGNIDVLDILNPSTPVLLFQIDIHLMDIVPTVLLFITVS